MSWLNYLWEKMVVEAAVGIMERHHRDRARMAVIAGDYVSLKAMLQGRFEDPELTALERHVFPLLKTRRCCLDIGANIGNHSVAFAQHFDRVVAFEPNPQTFDVLALNAKWNPKIQALQLGASSKAFRTQAVVPRGNLGAAKIVDAADASGQAVIEFECVRVDDVLPAEQWADVGFIKVDVEGHEHEALLGCEGILRTARPAIAFELLRQDHQKNAVPIDALLRRLGYARYATLQPEGLRPLPRFEERNYKMVIALPG